MTIQFNASASTDPEGRALTFHWDFGDGSTATGVTATHTYANAINTQVQLTVTDAQGATSSLVRPVSVLNSAGQRGADLPVDFSGDLLPGVFYQSYNAAAWNRTMGNINTLTVQNQGSIPNIDIRFRQQNDLLAFRFTGFLFVPESGTYTFNSTVRDNMIFDLAA
ncbi:MAG: PKD domain-containing protein [Verrucomicrobia bacterium]|nr:PKD domain-containing protein [Verrucomicrobiota bacterium]